MDAVKSETDRLLDLLARFGPGKWSFVWPGEGDQWQSRDFSEEALAEVLREMLA